MSTKKLSGSNGVAPAEKLLDLVVVGRRDEAPEIVSLNLARPDSGLLPPFEAGAHVDIHLHGDAGQSSIRQYSLCGSPAELGVYRLGILRAPDTRGGSKAVHRDLNIGARVQVGLPRNNFPLSPKASRSILLAGGIGVTPMIAMAYALAAGDRPYHLHYCTRDATRIAFRELLSGAPFAGPVNFYTDDSPARERFDAVKTLSAPESETHLYVCGPPGFISFVLAAAARQGWEEANIHVEYFAQTIDASVESAFQVRLGRNGRVLNVPAGRSIAQVLEDAGLKPQISCEQGICGTCLTHVLEGTPQHRDSYQTEAEKSQDHYIAICCSRSLSPMLVLDL